MPNSRQIAAEINRLVSYLVETGLADDQRFAFQRTVDGTLREVTFEGSEHVAFALRNRPYEEIYQHLLRQRAYNVKMLDGALIQMMYTFADEGLQRHRLAFFPAPHLEDFQNDPQVYLDDELHADVVARSVVSFPLRFDHHDEPDGRELVHPKSHLTLGQYRDCRIPVTAPMSPFWFMDFVLRNFYHTAFLKYADRLPRQSGDFAPSIRPSEQAVVHLSVPEGVIP